MVFFCVALSLSCTESEHLNNIRVNYESSKALSVSFSAEEQSDFAVFLKQSNSTPFLGTLIQDKQSYTFTPVVSFTSGATYEIRKNEDVLGSFTIDSPSNEKRPELIAIYPSLDTVPQNLLKMYFVFSEPMQHSRRALDFIRVFDNTTQEETNVFLEMETELWNKERTQLTLWLDPGRIKTDLIPNREKGLPLVQNHSYTVFVDSLWKSAQGYSLSKEYNKTLHVVEKDSKKPNLDLWDVVIPEKGSQSALEIHFDEPMDAVLSLETIHIKNTEGELIKGALSLSENEFNLKFKPAEKWAPGKYSMDVDPVLEDLAGNNLQRLFDTDISDQAKTPEKQKNTLHFVIE
ncbi:MAG: Ig-like domain-containing protein [Bacteroidota bacterium]